MRNTRHQRWDTERQSNRLAAVMAASSGVAVAEVVDAMVAKVEADAAVAEADVVYIDEEHWTPESQRRRDELIAAAVAAGKRIVSIHHTTMTPWRRIQ